MTVAYIAIGSNLASPLEQVNAALAPIADKFVADLDSRGLPGRAAYDAFVQAVADSK